MNIQAAARYLEIGFRIRRANWDLEKYLIDNVFLLEKMMLTIDDLLSDDWEVITTGLRKDFDESGRPEYSDVPIWNDEEDK